MIVIVCKGKKIATFERFEGAKALDYITEKALFRKETVMALPNVMWMCEPIP